MIHSFMIPITPLTQYLTGINILCVLLPAVFIFGSWFAFRFIWNITPDVREKMHAYFEAQKTGRAAD